MLGRHPDLNVLVTMAGIMRIEDWTTSTSGFLESAESIVTTNVLGPIGLISAFIDHLRDVEDATILTVSSALAFARLGSPPATTPSRQPSRCSANRCGCNWPTLQSTCSNSYRRRCALNCCPASGTENPLCRSMCTSTKLSVSSNPSPTHTKSWEDAKFLRHAEARGDYAKVGRS